MSRPISCSQTSEQSRFLPGELGTGAVLLLHFMAAGCGCKSQKETLEVSHVLKETSPSSHHQEPCPPLAEALVLNKECGPPHTPQAPHRLLCTCTGQQVSPLENVPDNVTTHPVLRRHLPAMGTSSQSPTAIPSLYKNRWRETFPLQDKGNFNRTVWK